jgi:hypothetical protein
MNSRYGEAKRIISEAKESLIEWRKSFDPDESLSFFGLDEATTDDLRVKLSESWDTSEKLLDIVASVVSGHELFQRDQANRRKELFEGARARLKEIPVKDKIVRGIEIYIDSELLDLEAQMTGITKGLSQKYKEIWESARNEEGVPNFARGICLKDYLLTGPPDAEDELHGHSELLSIVSRVKVFSFLALTGPGHESELEDALHTMALRYPNWLSPAVQLFYKEIAPLEAFQRAEADSQGDLCFDLLSRILSGSPLPDAIKDNLAKDTFFDEEKGYVSLCLTKAKSDDILESLALIRTTTGVQGLMARAALAGEDLGPFIALFAGYGGYFDLVSKELVDFYALHRGNPREVALLGVRKLT